MLLSSLSVEDLIHFNIQMHIKVQITFWLRAKADNEYLCHILWSQQCACTCLGWKYDTGAPSFFRTVPSKGIPLESFKPFINVHKYYVCSTEPAHFGEFSRTLELFRVWRGSFWGIPNGLGKSYRTIWMKYFF